MKKIFGFFLAIWFPMNINAQEINAQVEISHGQIGGSNIQVFSTLERSLKNFINNTSWTGKKLQNFEKIKCNFAIIIRERPSQNSFKGSIVVQSNRPVYDTQYETPLLNINDTQFSFEYTENENLIFNERIFSGKNLTDVIAFYIYMILGYDADSFAQQGGKIWFEKARKIAQNAQTNNFEGWIARGGMRDRSSLVNEILQERSNTLRNVFYAYHRLGLDNLSKQDPTIVKQGIANELTKLRYYEDNNYQMNYPLSIFIETKKNEIFNLYEDNNGKTNIKDLKTMMNTYAPKEIDKWNKLK